MADERCPHGQWPESCWNCDRDEMARLAAKLHEIGDYAHEHSTGPTVPDHLWTVREMAYGAIGATDSASVFNCKRCDGTGIYTERDPSGRLIERDCECGTETAPDFCPFCCTDHYCPDHR